MARPRFADDPERIGDLWPALLLTVRRKFAPEPSTPWKIRHRAPLGKLSREAPIVVNGLLLAGPASFNFVDRPHGPQTTLRDPLTQPHLSKKTAAVARFTQRSRRPGGS
jgi:hypothetical protein